MTDAELGKLSLLELRDLQAQIHVAIRARIRAQQARKMGVEPIAAPAAPAAQVAPFDLARERDAWLAGRSGGQGTPASGATDRKSVV